MKDDVTMMLSINDFMIEASYSKATVENIFIPMLEHWSTLARRQKKRIVVFLAAPPAVGKSTLGHFLMHLSQQAEFVELQVLGLDGFHYSSEYIKSHKVMREGQLRPMSEVKGGPESYDVNKLKQALSQIYDENKRWPVYSRAIHDVIEEQILIDQQVILIEGNWLLYEAEPWNELIEYATDTIFIEAEASLLERRLIDRKIRGGMEEQAAIDFVKKSDLKNVENVLNHSQKANWTFTLHKDHGLIMK